MNILMVNDMIYPDDMGGSGRYLREICRGLVSRGHRVHVITRQWKPDQPAFEDLNGIEVNRYAVNDQTAMSTIMSTITNSHKIFKRLLAKTEYDIINLHHPLTSLGVIYSKSRRAPAKVYTFHSPWHKEYEIKTESSKGALRGAHITARRFIEKMVINKCPVAIVLSRFMEGQLRTIYNNQSIKVELCPGGADIGRFRPSDDRAKIRSRLNLPEGKTVLITVRGLTPRTGVENLLKAMTDVVEKNNNTHLIIGGDGILKNKLMRIARELGLQDHITFTGYLRDEDLVSYYQAADYFILPTKQLEGFGLVTTEALACGLPVLATPVGGTVEILKRFDQDLLFDDAEPASMASLILEYIGKNEEEWGALSRRCRKFIEQNYSWDKSSEKTEEIFLSLAGS